MSDLSFAFLGARAEPYAAVPTLTLRVRISEAGGGRVHAIALRTQIQIDPRKRRYSTDEEERLPDLFGEPRRWAETLRPLLWTHVSLMVPAFEGAVEVDLPVTCTYDLEVAAAKYLAALEEGEIPLLLLFSGSVFAEGENGLRVDQVPWEKEAPGRVPVGVWREVMDRYFPGSAWIRVRRDTLDELQRFKGRRALPTWDDVIEALLQESRDPEPEKEPA